MRSPYSLCLICCLLLPLAVPALAQTGIGNIGGDVGYYEVLSNPSGGEVTFDGISKGLAPVTIEVPATGTPGHSVSVSMPGFVVWSRNLPGNPGAGQTIPVKVDLVPITITITSIGGDVGYYLVDSVPIGADVYFDGNYQGETPVKISVYVTGTPVHTISVSHPGYDTWTQTFRTNPAPGDAVPVTAYLQPSHQTGTIYVTSSPSGAYARVDGGDTSLTPASFTGLSSGYAHTVQISMPGYQPYSSSARVTAGGTTNVNAILSPTQGAGTLYIDSIPAGADIYLNTAYRGYTPSTIGNLLPGTYSIRLSRSGYEDWTGQVTIASGSMASISPTLRIPTNPTYGYISVASNPSGAQIFMDGQYQGVTVEGDAFDITSVVTGSHTILLHLTGYEDYSTTVNVAAGRVSTVSAILNANRQPGAGGTISVSSSPAGADVYLDNLYKGVSPLAIESVSQGSHSLMLRMNGYNDYSTTVTQGGSSSGDGLHCNRTPGSGGGVPAPLIFFFRRAL
jgi:hypothetical protein